MALSELSAFNEVKSIGREVKQTEQVGDRDAASPDPQPNLLARQTEFLDQRGAPFCLVNRVKVFARHVLDQGKLERSRVAVMADHGRDRLAPGQTRGSPPSLPGYQLIAAGKRTHEDRLQDTPGTDRLGEREQCLLVERSAWLIGIGSDQFHG
jgi:hypothetical protein